MTRILTIAACVLLAIGAAACGGGGGGESPGGGPPAFTASFVPQVTNPGSNSVSMIEASKSGDLVSIGVQVTDVNGLFGAAFDIDFDPIKLDFIDYQVGTALEAGLPAGSTVLYNITELQSGRLVAAVTRQGNVGTVDVSGAKRLVTLRFRVLEAGDVPLLFAAGSQLYDGQQPNQPIAGISWSGGTVKGQ